MGIAAKHKYLIQSILASDSEVILEGSRAKIWNLGCGIAAKEDVCLAAEKPCDSTTLRDFFGCLSYSLAVT